MKATLQHGVYCCYYGSGSFDPSRMPESDSTHAHHIRYTALLSNESLSGHVRKSFTRKGLVTSWPPSRVREGSR